MLEKIRTYDTINQFEGAMLLANSIDTKSTQFIEALARIDRAIDAETLKSTQAIENAKVRGLNDKALKLNIRKMFIPIFFKEDEKQTIIKMCDFIDWQSKSGNKITTDKGTLTAPKAMDKTSASRVTIMINAYQEFWSNINSREDVVKNEIVAGWITDQSKVSSSQAMHMASIIRPDWAKDLTWKNTIKEK